mmetsp:Transcript_3013/g.4348  ORF Transcript_3013/g.4348 Transcript_3013/m.4348 type:complete len:111 (+) Transcript_3013:258-590(+)
MRDCCSGDGMASDNITDTIRPYIPITPAITTGMIFFMTLPGCRIPVCTSDTPDFHVPHCNMRAKTKCNDKELILPFSFLKKGSKKIYMWTYGATKVAKHSGRSNSKISDG